MAYRMGVLQFDALGPSSAWAGGGRNLIVSIGC